MNAWDQYISSDDFEESFKKRGDEMSMKEKLKYVKKWGPPWWIEPTPELIEACPLRFRIGKWNPHAPVVERQTQRTQNAPPERA